MYALQIFEWTHTPEEALDISIQLNDKYEMDGRDPNGYVGCMWSVCGVHDMVSFSSSKRLCNIAYCSHIEHRSIVQTSAKLHAAIITTKPFSASVFVLFKHQLFKHVLKTKMSFNCWCCVQGWKERPIFGKIRYMNYNGCKRKFKVQKYIDMVNEKVEELKNMQ